MSAALLDSFQLIVALYLLYVAIRGSGQLYRFADVPEEQRPKIHRLLRRIYAAGGLAALADAGVNALQNSMFTRETVGGAVVVTQNYSIRALPFLSDRLLSVLSAVLTCTVVLLLLAAFLRLRRAGKKS